jgi:hypothetical protein
MFALPGTDEGDGAMLVDVLDDDDVQASRAG